MSRGGYREGAGVKPTWKHGKTKTIRVPVDLADEVLRLARLLDEGKKLTDTLEIIKSSITDYDTESRVIDLSGISIKTCNGKMALYLEDLAKLGYEILPIRLGQAVKSLFR